MRNWVFILIACSVTAWGKVQQIGGVTLVTEPAGVFVGREVELKLAGPHILLVESLSDQVVWLHHPVIYPDTSAGWTTKLDPKRWTALRLAQNPFSLRCIEARRSGEQVVACESVLKIHRILKVNLTEEAAGTYWLAENQTLDVLIDSIQSRGITL